MNSNQEQLLRSLNELFDIYTVTQWLSAAKAIGLPVQEDGIRQLRSAVRSAVKVADRNRTELTKKPKPKSKKAPNKSASKKSLRKNIPKDPRSNASLLRQNLFRAPDQADGEFVRWMNIISPTSSYALGQEGDESAKKPSGPSKDDPRLLNYFQYSKKPRR